MPQFFKSCRQTPPLIDLSPYHVRFAWEAISSSLETLFIAIIVGAFRLYALVLYALVSSSTIVGRAVVTVAWTGLYA